MPAAFIFLLLLVEGAVGAPDHYAALGVQRDATEAQLRKAYRKAALRHHPDKNPSAKATAEWLRVQEAYEALLLRRSSSASQQQPDDERQRRRAAWQRFWQAPRRPSTIPSDASQQLDTGAFQRLVLGGSGAAWVVQIYADASPYCRVLAGSWETAARELGSLARFGRIDFAAEPMLVRFVASHIGLFDSQQPAKELPVVFGLPAACSSLACARVFNGKFTAPGLRGFAAALLHLAPLPPLSSRPVLLAAWRRAAAARGAAALLVLLPEGQTEPLELLAAAARVRGKLRVAAAGWRPADRALWVEAVGVTSAPALILWCGAAPKPAAVVQASLLTNRIDWSAEVERLSHLAAGPLQAAAGGASKGLAAAAVQLALLASRADLLWQQAAEAAGGALRLVDWRAFAMTTLIAVAICSFKFLLDWLSGKEEAFEGGPASPCSGPTSPVHLGYSRGRLQEMQHSDWEPSPGRYLVLLPVPASSGGGSERLAAQHARQALASLAAMFQRELRLAFRLAPVSHALPRLLAGSGAQLTLAGEPPAALVLHPRRGRFQTAHSFPLTNWSATDFRWPPSSSRSPGPGGQGEPPVSECFPPGPERFPMTEQVLPLKRLRTCDGEHSRVKRQSPPCMHAPPDGMAALPAPAAVAATSPTTPTQPSAMASSSPPAFPQRGQPAQTPQQTLPTIPEMHERDEAADHCPWPLAAARAAARPWQRQRDPAQQQQQCERGLEQPAEGEMEAEGGAEEAAAGAPNATAAGRHRRRTAASAAAELAASQQYHVVLPLHSAIPAAVLSLHSPHAPPRQPPLQAGWAVVPFGPLLPPGSPTRGAGQLLPNGASGAAAAAHWHQQEHQQKVHGMLQSQRQRKPHLGAADSTPMATDDGHPAGLSLQLPSFLHTAPSTHAALAPASSSGSSDSSDSTSSSDSMEE
ncbi:dnaJ-like protein subfamily C member 10 isoform X1 isoform B [Micractinium conductrix]|uniref:DnaJ-like protein subfamily C member 10 isoform X1 isoform B n=1 Tax=Micractinium conductrix TaxID=554055 RepID=A0A2P6V2X6_9CHLO|nr:dnaJ-like protein subfamily C member 10 isoform X1 isoform B [Micractinium conductrix]|eukprot:PSC68446.1 dnaJ-like protein subfamily C member 10 isoform X1 isoform B [Micractinium conductrix]